MTKEEKVQFNKLENHINKLTKLYDLLQDTVLRMAGATNTMLKMMNVIGTKEVIDKMKNGTDDN